MASRSAEPETYEGVPEAFNALTAIEAARSIARSCEDGLIREAFQRTLDELERMMEFAKVVRTGDTGWRRNAEGDKRFRQEVADALRRLDRK